MVKVSVIVPIYNVSEYITGCMRSLASQTFCDFEVILVDDCGTDDSVDKAVEVLSSCNVNHKLLHHKHNRGLSAARNTGMSVAEGEYIYFLDSDDTISSDCLELLVGKAEELHVQMVAGGIHVDGNDDNIPLLNTKAEAYYTNADVFKSYLAGEYYMMAWNKLVRKDFLLDNHVEFVEGLVHEDNPWSFETACKLSSIAFVENPTYNYLVRENSLQTDKNFGRHYAAYKSIMKEIAAVAVATGHNKTTEFFGWYERQKALFFGQTIIHGTVAMQYDIYKLIHSLLPVRTLCKADCHYMFPTCLGYIIYRKFYGYHLC